MGATWGVVSFSYERTATLMVDEFIPQAISLLTCKFAESAKRIIGRGSLSESFDEFFRFCPLRNSSIELEQDVNFPARGRLVVALD